MPGRYYEYHCGHVRTDGEIPYESVRISEQGFNSDLSFHRPQRYFANDDCVFRSPRFPETSAAAALQDIDRETHAGLAAAGTLRRPSIRYNTQIHTPRYTGERRGSDYIRTGRVGQVVLSLKKYEKSEKHRERRYFKDYPCTDCRRYEALERQRCGAETERMIMALRPPPGEGQRLTGGNRYRGDDWFEDYARVMGRRVRFDEGG